MLVDEALVVVDGEMAAALVEVLAVVVVFELVEIVFVALASGDEEVGDEETELIDVLLLLLPLTALASS